MNEEGAITRENVVLGKELQGTIDSKVISEAPKTLKESESVKRERAAIAGVFINFAFGRIESEADLRPPFGVLEGESLRNIDGSEFGIPDGRETVRLSYDEIDDVSQIEQIGMDVAWTMKKAIGEELQYVRTHPESHLYSAYQRLETLTQSFFDGFDKVTIDDYPKAIGAEQMPVKFIDENVRGLLQFMYPVIQAVRYVHNKEHGKPPSGAEIESIGKNSFGIVADFARIHIMDQGSWPEESTVLIRKDDPRFSEISPKNTLVEFMINPDVLTFEKQGDGMKLAWKKINGTENYFQRELKLAQESTHKNILSINEENPGTAPEKLEVTKCAALLSTMSLRQASINNPHHKLPSSSNALQGLWNMYLGAVGKLNGTPL